MTLVNGWVRDILTPFAFPRTMSRKPAAGKEAIWPEDDKVTIEVRAGDLMRLQVLMGLPAESVCLGSTLSQPGPSMQSELERIESRSHAILKAREEAIR